MEKTEQQLNLNLIYCGPSRPPRQRVTLEPRLEKIAGHLNARECRELAEVFARRAHQLVMKALVLDAHVPVAKKTATRLPPFVKRRLPWN